MKSRIIIAGGSGFIGQELAKHFVSQGKDVIILTRGKSNKQNGMTFLNWNGKTIDSWARTFEGAETVINLTGKSVDCRYTKSNKREILASRVDATQLIGRVISQLRNPPSVWINASTATIYKHSLFKEMTESNGEIGNDFSMTVAKRWEKAFYACETPNTRKVATRVSLVMGNSGGVFPVLNNLAKFGLGGKHGLGTQKFAWIHIEDLIAAFQFIIDQSTLKGSINITAPNSSTNSEVMFHLRQVNHMGFGIPTPKTLLKIGSFFLSTEPELILKSRYVYPEILCKANFKFKFSIVENAIANLIQVSN